MNQNIGGELSIEDKANVNNKYVFNTEPIQTNQESGINKNLYFQN